MNKAETEELTSLLSGQGFLDDLSQKEKETYLDNTHALSYKSGDIIHSPARKCAGVIVVRSGCLRTYLLSDEGREVTLYRVNPGEICILSASCVLSEIAFDVFIEAEEDSEVFLTDVSTFRRLSESNIYLRCAGYRSATERFSDVMWAMQQILFRGVDKRLASFLYDEHVRKNSNTVEIRQDQIATHIGSSREVVSRMMKYFASEGIAKSRRGCIEILNEDKLRALALS